MSSESHSEQESFPTVLQTSSKIDEVMPALLDVQEVISAIKKDTDNPFFSSRYTSLKAIWQELKPICSKAGLVVIQVPQSVGTDALLMETWVFHAKSGQHIHYQTTFPIVPMKGVFNAQTTGSAITYARRYTLSPIFGIVSEEDDDGNSSSGHKIAAPTADTKQAGKEIDEMFG